eukprot:s47_g2.t1
MNIICLQFQGQDRLEFLPLDVASDASVEAAAETVREKFGTMSMYGIVNNAGVGFQNSMADTLNINTYGPKREGRIVNTASASGPNYNAGAPAAEREMLTNPDVTWEELSATMEKMSKDPGGRQPYGFSKACLIAYTMMLAREKPELKINAMTPGYILTDITRGMGATKPPEEGTKAAIYCLTGDLKGNGWYYGSDALRSPIDRYRPNLQSLASGRWLCAVELVLQHHAVAQANHLPLESENGGAEMVTGADHGHAVMPDCAAGARVKELQRIDAENQRLLKRLQSTKAAVNMSKFEKDHQVQQRYMKMHCEHPKEDWLLERAQQQSLLAAQMAVRAASRALPPPVSKEPPGPTDAECQKPSCKLLHGTMGIYLWASMGLELLRLFEKCHLFAE